MNESQLRTSGSGEVAPSRSGAAWPLLARSVAQRLDEGDARVVLVVAGAGYGKSSLIRQWTDGRDVAWLTLTPGDRDVGTLARHLVEAAERLGGAGGVAGPEVAAGSGDAAATEAIAASVALALESTTATRPVFVLDDLHELGDGPGSELIGGLVRQAPARVRIVIGSRMPPPFRTQRLRGRGELTEVTAGDLAFNRDEIGVLLGDVLGNASDDLAGALLDVTGGWPAAVRLGVEALRNRPAEGRRAEIARLRSASGPLFAFLAEEVFANEPPAVRDLLAAVAPFEDFDAELCASLGVADAETLIDELGRRGLFVESRKGAGRRALHDLVRAYALDRLPLEEARLRASIRVAAELEEQRGDHEAALRLAATGADAELAAGLLTRLGPGLLLRGRTEAVLAAGHALPAREHTAAIEMIVGEARAHRSEWGLALECYARAGGDAAELPSALAWRMGRAYYERGDRAAGMDVLDRGRADGVDLRDDALWLAYRALTAWRFDRPDTAAIASEAVAIAERSGDASARSVAHTAACFATLVSDTERLWAHYGAAKRYAHEAGDVIQILRLTLFTSDQLGPEAEFTDLSAVLPMAEVAGNPLWLSRVLSGRALLLIDLGRYEAAAADLQRAREVEAKLEQRVGEPTVLFQAMLAAFRGDLARSRILVDEGVRLAEETGDRDNLAFGRMLLARILARTDPDRARSLATEALAGGLPHHLDDLHLGAGWVALTQGRGVDAAAHAAEAIGPTAGIPSRIATYASARELAAMATADRASRRAQLQEALDLWESVGNRPAAAANRLALALERGGPGGRAAAASARRDLVLAGVKASAEEFAGLLAVLPVENAAPVSVRVMGGFAVMRYGVPATLAEWKSKKARDLLKLLVGRRGPMTREEVGETLWPDEEPAAVSNRLSVALSLLRSVLDPEKRFAADHFLAADHESISLRDSDLLVDLEEFLANGEAGLQLQRRGAVAEATDRLEAAEAAYAGEPFEEDAYADWAVLPREHAKALYGRVGRALADIATAGGDHDAAAELLRRVVARDPYDEPAHLALVAALARGRHHGDGRRAYQAYVSRMSELEIEPAPYPGDSTSGSTAEAGA